jgi:hypothetical protein
MMKRKLLTTAFIGATALLALPMSTAFSSSDSITAPTVITLTQTPCQFLEIEAKDQGFTSTKTADCEAINKKTAKKRLSEAKVLRLKPGKYIFRVTNKNVPYGLGFYLRGAGLYGRLSLPKVSGGGLDIGVTQDYAINLVPGEYIYSCPLNTTPDYSLIVEG